MQNDEKLIYFKRLETNLKMTKTMDRYQTLNNIFKNLTRIDKCDI